VYYTIIVETGKLNFVPGGPEPLKIERLFDYPDTDEALKVAAILRATSYSMKFDGHLSHRPLDRWYRYFWETGRTIGECKLIPQKGISISYLTPDFMRYHLECFREYHEQVTDLFDEILDNYEYSLDPIKDDIILGLLTRIHRIAVQCLSFIPNWVADVAEALLRMVVDSYIHLHWFLRNATDEDFKKFYDYGLGQQKLLSEHTRAYLEKHGLKEEDISELNISLNYIKKHKMPELIPVHVGSWSKKTLRDLAIEADCREIYAMIYSPTSSVIHGMYDSLDRFYLLQCANPLHGLHKVPYHWAKSPISTYALSNILSLADSALMLLCEITRTEYPKEPIGNKTLNKLFSYDFQEEEATD
jgi:hypothetical protein